MRATAPLWKNYILKIGIFFIKVAYDMARDPQIAEDMVSETCLSLIKRLDDLRKINSCKLRAYIVTTIRNTSLDYVRKRNTGVMEMRKVLCSLRDAGKTILIASHNMQDIDALCDTRSEMDAGMLRVAN